MEGVAMKWSENGRRSDQKPKVSAPSLNYQQRRRNNEDYDKGEGDKA